MHAAAFTSCTYFIVLKSGRWFSIQCKPIRFMLFIFCSSMCPDYTLASTIGHQGHPSHCGRGVATLRREIEDRNIARTSQWKGASNRQCIPR